MPAVSKHLRVLERAGLIAPRPRGAVAAVPPAGGAAQGRGRLDRTLPRHLGRAARPPRQLPAGTRRPRTRRRVMAVSHAANSRTFEVRTPTDTEITDDASLRRAPPPGVRGDDQARARQALVGHPRRRLLGAGLRDRPAARRQVALRRPGTRRARRRTSTASTARSRRPIGSSTPRSSRRFPTSCRWSPAC